MTATIKEPSRAKRIDVTVKLDAGVVRDAKIVAAYQDKSVAEVLSDFLRPIVAKALADEQTKNARAAESPKAPKGRGASK